MESDFFFSAYYAGLISPRVTATVRYPHHVICGYLQKGRSNGWIVTNIRGPSVPGLTRAWRYLFADGQIDYQSGQLENFFGATPNWPYGLPLRRVPKLIPI